MNTSFSEDIDNWEIEIPSDFATTCSNFTPPSYSSASPIPSISEESQNSQPNLPIQPFTIRNTNLIKMRDYSRRNNRNVEDEGEEQQHNKDNNNEQNLTAALERLGTLLQNMNRNNNNRPQRETKLVDIPTFRAGSQDPMTWLVDFQDACIANHINEECQLEILSAYLKEVAHTW